MKSPTPYSHRRNSSSGYRSTPDHSSYSSSYASSEVSTVDKSNSGRNPVSAAARSVAGIFVACFTPPEASSSKSFVDSEEFKGPSGSSAFSVCVVEHKGKLGIPFGCCWWMMFACFAGCFRSEVWVWFLSFDLVHLGVWVSLLKPYILFGCWENTRNLKKFWLSWNFFCGYDQLSIPEVVHPMNPLS